MVGIIRGIAEISFRDRSVGKAIETFVRIVGVSGREPVKFILRRKEVSVFHSQRFEDAGAEKFVQRLAGNNFHQTSEDIYAQAVLP